MGTRVYEEAVDALFPQGNGGVHNVKFFRGRRREVTREQLTEQLLAATRQIEEGEAERIENIDGEIAA